MIYPLLLPPDLFPLELQPIIYFVLLPLAILVLMGLGLIIWFVVMPSEARTLSLNRLKKKPLVLYETEDGTAHLETATIYPEGFLIGNQSKNMYLIPRPTQKKVVERELKAKGYSKAKIEKLYNVLQEMEEKALSAGILKGLGVRIFFAYQSVGIATSLASLVGLTYTGDKNQYMAIPVIAKTKKVIKPSELALHENKKTKEWFVNVALPVNPNIVQKYFVKNYTQNQLIALFRKGVEVGLAKASNPLGKWLVPLLIILAVVVVIVIGIAVVLGGV